MGGAGSAVRRGAARRPIGWRSGFRGALTTFSTLSFDVVRLVEERHVGRAPAYLAGSLVLGLAAAALGYLLAR